MIAISAKRLAIGKYVSKKVDQRFITADLQASQTAEVDALAVRLLERGIIPPAAAPDAEHIALAAVHAMNFLLTWNCKHMANALHRRRLEAVCADVGLVCPIICTPQHLSAI